MKGQTVRSVRTHAQSLKQVLVLFSKVAYVLSGAFQRALGLWLQLHDAAQQHKGHHSALLTSTIAAVEAALHAVPKHGAQEQRQAWMKLHVPHVSKAIAAYVIDQSVISLKRLKILQQLVADQAVAFEEQLPARVSAEAALHLQLDAAGRIASNVLAPLASMIGVLSNGQNQSYREAARTGQRNKQNLAYMQRDQLLVKLTEDLVAERNCIVQHIYGVGQALQALQVVQACLNDTLQDAAVSLPTLGNITHQVQCLAAAVSMSWVGIALELPPSSKHQVAVAWLNVADWEALIAAPTSTTPQSLMATMQHMVSSVLARQDLLELMTGENVQPITGRLLFAYGVKNQQLKSAGLPEDQVQQLMLWKQQAREKLKVARTGGSAVDGSNSTAAAHLATAAATAHQGEAAADDDKLDDMQALLELMYGTLDIKL